MIVIFVADHATASSTMRARQRACRSGLFVEWFGNHQSDGISLKRKKTGAPTPAPLVFGLNGKLPDLDQIVAKR